MELKTNDIVMIDGKRFRILSITDSDVIYIEMDINRYNIQVVATELFTYMYDEGKITKAGEEPVPIIQPTREALSKQADIDAMLEKYYPDWDILQKKVSVPEVSELTVKYSVSDVIVRKWIRRYLQSGRELYALMDMRLFNSGTRRRDQSGKPVRATGRKPAGCEEHFTRTQEDTDNFEHYYQLLVKSAEKGASVKLMYDRMIRERYSSRNTSNGVISQPVPFDKDKRPSYGMFYRYVKERLGTVTLKQLSKGKREARNSERMLVSNSQYGVTYAGQLLEMDENEVDLMLVSPEDRTKVIGRPVLYLAVDVYSCCAVAAHLGINNNSYVGATNTFATLFEDHNKQTSVYGITIPKEVYPSEFLPAGIRVDHGAEYTSAEFRRFCSENRISLDLVPTATGSMKGIVEQFFHGYQEMVRNAAIKAGSILKRHDSKHYEEACMTLDEARAALYNYIEYYNNHLRDSYPLTKQMIDDGIRQIPVELWNYSRSHSAPLKAITDANRDRLLFSLFKADGCFRLSRKGIECRGLYYLNDDKRLLKMISEAGGRTIKLTGVRYDPRTVNEIYMLMDGKLVSIPLNTHRENQKTFLDMSWYEYEQYHKKALDTRKEYEEEDYARRLAAQEIMDNVARTARKAKGPVKASRKNIIENRNAEKSLENIETAISARLGIRENPAAAIECSQEIPADDTEREIPEDDLDKPVETYRLGNDERLLELMD